MCDKQKHSFSNLVEVMMHFSNQETCKEYLENIRWKGNITCPVCEGEKVYILKKSFTYKCANKECKQNIFSVTKGTIFENSPIPLQKWFAAIWLMTSHKKGISSLQLHRDLGISQPSCWFMAHRIRHAIRTKSFNKPLEGIVEADESYFGGRNKNRHAHKRVAFSQGRSTKDKTAVFGLLERGGQVVAMRVENTSGRVLKPLIVKNVVKGASVMTDEWTAYKGLHTEFNHKFVRHGSGEYVIGDCHTNTIEGFWSLLKRGIIGIYHSVTQTHLDKYLDEFEFRYNTINSSDSERFVKMLSLAECRLTYNQLTAK